MRKTIFFIGPLMLIMLWWLIGALVLIDPIYLPSLPSVIKSLANVITSGGGYHIWSTFYKTIVGFVLASILAIPLGVIFGSNKKLYFSVEFVIDFFRSLPSLALFPLFLLFFGIGDAAKIAIAAFIAFWIILVNTIYGVWNTPAIRKQIGVVFRASRFQILKDIIIPDALPQIFAGLRIAVSLILISIVVTEMFIGTKFGLGQKIFDSYTSYRIPQLYAYILITGLLGYFINKGFVFFEKRIVHWTGK